MRDFTRESLVHDPVHGYVPFVSIVPSGETSERTLLDNPWLQRLRQIHQLQTAWWVYPSAEHTRFQHVIGAMHMASRVMDGLYESLHEVCRGELPSRNGVDCLCRVAALLHDVGHGPFGHFFDEHFLKPHYGLTHELLGAHIVRHELGGLVRGVRECPAGRMDDGEEIDPEHVAMLIQRPTENDGDQWPRWLVLLRGLFCGIYTVDNLDFVLRDSYMTGYSGRAYDLERLLRYSFFSERGLTIHQKGIGALVKFIQTKSELFRAVYFHRTVRAIDKTLREVFVESRELLFPHDPRERLDDYCKFTEWSLLIDVGRWSSSEDSERRALALRWERILGREVDWIAVEDRNITYKPGESEEASVFSNAEVLEQALRARLPEGFRRVPMQIDLPRHNVYRPDSMTPSAGQNFQYKPSTGKVYPLTDDQLFQQLPLAHRACRIYLQKNHPPEHAAAIGEALDALVGSRGEDDLTNM